MNPPHSHKEKIFLIDASSLFFRAFFAIRELTTPNGLPVNAIYGFTSMIARLLKEENPKYFVFCYDRKEPSFRKEIFPEYKAHRTEMPEDLQKQLPSIFKLADLLGVPTFDLAGYEADDLIGSITQVAQRHNLDVVIVSGDKDFAQLVNPNVTLYDTMKNVRYTPQGVEDKWGIRPHQMIDYLAIVGDSSDNIPGVHGIGEKGALKLLQTYGSLENIYKHIDEITAKSLKEKLIQSKEMAFLSQKLVTIETHLPVPEDLKQYQLRPIATEDLRNFLRELNFKTLETSLLGDNSPPAEAAPQILSENSTPSSSTYEFIILLSPQGLIEALPPTPSPIELWALSESRGTYLVHNHKVYSLGGDLTHYGPVLENLPILWHGYNLKEFWRQIRLPSKSLFQKDQDQLPVQWDSMLAAYVLRASDCTDFKKIYEKVLKKSYPDLASPEYFITAQFELYNFLKNQIYNSGQQKILQNLEIPLTAILYEMEERGVKIDIPHLKKLSTQSAEEIQNLEKEIYKHSKHPFNVSSPKQLSVVLFEELGLPVIKKTKTGYSTDTDVLEQLQHPIAPLILEYREISKLKSTYIDPLPLLADPNSHRVHTHFNQALTSTGRLSSENPNLQNIPIRSPRGQQVRKAFISELNKKLVSIDYSQIELRILAHISEDPGLIKAFSENLDIHAATAAEVFGVDVQQVTTDQRRIAKAVNFGIAYGQGAFGLAETLGIPRGESQQIIKKYFQKFSNIQSYIESTIAFAHKNGFVETLLGRRRYLEELKSSHKMLVKFGERAAINAPIQGTASDIVKKAMIEVSQVAKLPLLLQVHDELIFELTDEEIEKHLKRIVSIMEGVVELRVPLKVNTGIGNNWEEAH